MYHLKDFKLDKYQLSDPAFISVNYIISTGTQYINTGYIADSVATKIEIKFNRRTSATYNGIWGARTAVSTNNFTYFDRAGSNNTTKIFGFGNELIATSQPTYYQVDCTMYNENNVLYATDGTNPQVLTHAAATWTGDYPLFIFGISSAGALNSGTGMYLYYMKIWHNGVLVRNFIPVILKTTGAVGLWDLVEGRFYANAGTGSFTYA